MLTDFTARRDRDVRITVSYMKSRRPILIDTNGLYTVSAQVVKAVINFKRTLIRVIRDDVATC